VDLTPYIGTIVTIVLAFVGFYGMVSTRLARTEQRIEDLVKEVEKHNNVIERTYGVERDLNTAFKRIDELKDADKKLEDKIEKFHG